MSQLVISIQLGCVGRDIIMLVDIWEIRNKADVP